MNKFWKWFWLISIFVMVFDAVEVWFTNEPPSDLALSVLYLVAATAFWDVYKELRDKDRSKDERA